MKLLEGKTALITGASRGIGKAVALAFAKQGANIAFTDLRYDENAQVFFFNFIYFFIFSYKILNLT